MPYKPVACAYVRKDGHLPGSVGRGDTVWFTRLVCQPSQSEKKLHHIMGTCSEARRLKERFHKYRMSLKKKADLAKEHQAEIQMVLFRKGVLYDIPGDRREESRKTLSSRSKHIPLKASRRHHFTFVEPAALRPSQLSATTANPIQDSRMLRPVESLAGRRRGSEVSSVRRNVVTELAFEGRGEQPSHLTS